MGTTALHIIRLGKGLPPIERQAVCQALAELEGSAREPVLPGMSFTPADYEGLSDNDPFFATLADIERERHTHGGRPAPELE